MPDATGALPVNAIEIAGLTKVYGRNGGVRPIALDDVSLTIPRGAFFGLLGPNGAGKSTLINILAGLVIKTTGTARVWGFDIDTHSRWARASIGVVPQELMIDPFFTAREALELQAGFFAVPKAERRTAEILDALGLSGVANSYARRLSGGMRRRLLVAKALVHAPPVLVLDEPTAGVDVDLRHQLWSYVKRLNAAGTTILLTTHYLEEAEQLCDRIAILHRGAVVACEDTPTLVARLDRKTLTIALAEEPVQLPAPLARFETELGPGRQLAVRYRPSETEVGEILAAVREAGLTIVDLTSKEADLEDIFLHLTSDGTGQA